MEKKYTATHIANYFVENTIYVDNIRLNKLVYIAFGFYYAYFDKPLFTEVIQAWKLGPVIPSVYHDFKHYGYNQITKPSYAFVDELETEMIIPKVDENDKSVKAILDGVIKIYGKMSHSDLINRTHREGTPWHQSYKKGLFDVEIKTEIIKKYYKELLNQK